MSLLGFMRVLVECDSDKGKRVAFWNGDCRGEGDLSLPTKAFCVPNEPNQSLTVHYFANE